MEEALQLDVDSGYWQVTINFQTEQTSPYISLLSLPHFLILLILTLRNLEKLPYTTLW